MFILYIYIIYYILFLLIIFLYINKKQSKYHNMNEQKNINEQEINKTQKQLIFEKRDANHYLYEELNDIKIKFLLNDRKNIKNYKMINISDGYDDLLELSNKDKSICFILNTNYFSYSNTFLKIKKHINYCNYYGYYDYFDFSNIYINKTPNINIRKYIYDENENKIIIIKNKIKKAYYYYNKNYILDNIYISGVYIKLKYLNNNIYYLKNEYIKINQIKIDKNNKFCLL